MRKRRGRGEGSISGPRKDGLWIADLSCGIGPDGRRIRYRKYASTKRGAEAALSRLKDERNRGVLVVSDRITVEELFERWFRDEVAQNCEPRTIDEYRGLYTRYILRHMGGTHVQKLTPQLLQNWLSTLAATNLGPVSRRKSLNIFRQALDYALRLGILANNPAKALKPPKINRSHRTPLTIEQVRAYLDVAAHDRLGPLVLLAIATTMREGELLGLQWGDIRQGKIHARHALKRKSSGTYYLGEISKSSSSRRTIHLPQVAIDALAAHKERMEAEGHGSKYVFCTPKGTPLNPSNLRERFHYPMLKLAGAPRVTFHDLRHTAATLLLELGVHPKIAQERLGHSTIQMTYDLYSHVMPGMGEDAASELDKRLRK